MNRLLIGLILFAGVACSRISPRKAGSFNSIDSVISVQVKYLSEGRFRLQKFAAIGLDTTSVALSPDSTGWERELAVFRQLEVAERPSNRDKYTMVDREDMNSNLRVRLFEAKDTPVPFIRFYYLGDLSDVRRIESEYYESNPLYTSKRDLVMEFEELDGVATLRRYQVDGFQKIQMSDSVHFSIDAEIIF
jgi:hypothetical protein